MHFLDIPFSLRAGSLVFWLPEPAKPEANQEKRPEFDNNRYCHVLLFLIASYLVRTKTINVKR